VPYSFDTPARPSARNTKKLDGFPSNLLGGLLLKTCRYNPIWVNIILKIGHCREQPHVFLGASSARDLPRV
jgi:hypothetical protein